MLSCHGIHYKRRVPSPAGRDTCQARDGPSTAGRRPSVQRMAGQVTPSFGVLLSYSSILYKRDIQRKRECFNLKDLQSKSSRSNWT
jgi:hypothetical protein